MKRKNRLIGDEDIENSVEELQFIVSKLEIDEELRPVKIFGIKMDNDMIAKIGAFAASGIFAIIQILIG